MRHVLHVTPREQLARMGSGRLDHPLITDLEEAFVCLESYGAYGRVEAGQEEPGASRQGHDTGDDRASGNDDTEALGQPPRSILEDIGERPAESHDRIE